MSQIHEFFEASHSFAGSDRFPGKLDSVAQARGFSTHHETCGSVQKDDVPARTFPVGKKLPYDRCVLAGVPALDGAYGCARDAEILGRHIVGADFPTSNLGNFAFPADCDLIQSVGSVNDEGTFRSEFAEHLGHYFGEVFVVNPEDLRRGTSGIAYWAEEVEHRADLHFPAGKHDVPHRLMQERGKQKTDTRLIDAARDSLWRQVDAYAKRLHDIRAPAKARDAPVSVFGDSHTCAGNHKCRGRRDIKGSGCIPSGTAGVDKHLAIGAGERRADGDLGVNRGGFRAHHLGKPNELIHGLAFHAQSRQECGNLGVSGFAGHDLVHQGLGLGPAEVLTFYNPSNTIYYVHFMEYIRSARKIRSKNRGLTRIIHEGS
jgi:hypothetical protein